MSLVSSKEGNVAVKPTMDFVEEAKEIVALNADQKRSLVNFVRKHPVFIDALSKHSTNIIDKLGINGGLSQADIEYIETLVIQHMLCKETLVQEKHFVGSRRSPY